MKKKTTPVMPTNHTVLIISRYFSSTCPATGFTKSGFNTSVHFLWGVQIHISNHTSLNFTLAHEFMEELGGFFALVSNFVEPVPSVP